MQVSVVLVNRAESSGAQWLVLFVFFSALSKVHLVNRRAELADRHSSQVFLADDALLGAMHDQRDRDRQDLHRFLSAAHR